MQINKTEITAELKSLIDRSNALLNASKNKQQVTAYLYIIFSLIALTFFGLFAIRPTLSTISELNKKYEEDKLALVQLKQKNAALKSLSAQYITIQNDLSLIESAIPRSPKVAELTRQLEVIATKNNLNVQKIDTGLMELYPTQNSKDPIFSYSFSIGVSGDESDVNAFVSEVINMSRILGIEQLTTGRQQDQRFSANITGKAFFYRE